MVVAHTAGARVLIFHRRSFSILGGNLQLEYTIEEGEFVEAGRLWAKNKRLRRINSYMTSWRGNALLLLSLLFGFLLSQARGEAVAWIWIPLGAIYLIYLLSITLRALLCPRALRKSYNRQKPAMSLRLLIEEDRVESERADRATFGRFSWNAFIGFLEGPGTIVLYLNPYQFIAIPKRVMTSEQHRELLPMLNMKIPVNGDAAWK
jgi:YcxB-like protein